jgi:hypothetical protein
MANKSNIEAMRKIANTRNYVKEARKLIEDAFITSLSIVKAVPPKNYCDDDLDTLYNPIDWTDKWWQI